jgi:hypothetical protein
VQLAGWNVPVTEVTADGVSPLPLPAGAINRPAFAYDTLPDVFEKEPNDSVAAAQAVSLGTIVNGRIGAPGDQDYYRVDLSAGDELIAEVDARRFDSPLDGMLRVIDASGKALASNDDSPDASCGLITHQADPKLSFKAPAAGIYYIQLSDTQGKGGDSYSYRLRVSRLMPDFVLIAGPGSISGRPGGVVPVSIQAVRRDRFDGEISLSLPDAPGWQLDGGRIPPGTSKVRATVTFPYSASEEPIAIHIAGTAKIAGKTVTHQATPAENMMQAFAYRHLVPVDNLMALSFGRPAPRMSARVLTPGPIRLHAGGTQRLVISSPQTWFGPISYSLSDAPEGISIASTTSAGEETVLLLKSDAQSTSRLRGT